MNSGSIRSVSLQVFDFEPKEEQIGIIRSYWKGHDSVAVAPTGWGKSLIFQIAPFLFDGSRYNIKCDSPDETWQSNVTTDISDLSNFDDGDNYPHIPVNCHDTISHSTPNRPDRDLANEDMPDIETLSTLIGDISLQSSDDPGASTSGSSKISAQFIVIMPLVALIKDAILKIKEVIPQISAIHLTTSTLTEALSAVIIFSSPENILSTSCGRRVIQKLAIKVVFIDEFHMVEAWGLSSADKTAFRKAYGELGQLRAFISHAPFVCLSATAPDDVIASVSSSLHLRSPKIVKVDINKRNITYHTLGVKGEIPEDFRWLCELVRTSAADQLPRMLIFFNNLDYLTNAYQYVMYHGKLLGNKEKVGLCVMYHLLTDHDIKQDVIEDMAKADGKTKIVFCSKSLSMGINMAQVKYVIHYGPPTTTDAFLQETGRAAREPKIHAHSILLTFPRMASGRTLDDTMDAYSKVKVSCLRSSLLSKFHCTKPTDQKLCCDICEDVICEVKDCIQNSYDSSITESFSDSEPIITADQPEDLEDDDDESVFYE